MADEGSWWSRLKRGWLLEVIYKIGDYIWSHYLYGVVLALLTLLASWSAYLSAVDPLVRFTLLTCLAVLLFVLGSLIWVNRQLAAPKRPQGEPASILERPDSEVRFAEFRLPSNWGLHFQRRQIGSENGIQIEAEELHLDVRALRRMQNVKFEILLKNVRGGLPKDVIRRNPSGVLSGVVQKDADQQYVLMSRKFWNVSAAYTHPGTGQQNHTLVRVEHEVIFFPENSSLSFQGDIGQSYAFEIKMLHDEGSDTASFTIALERGTAYPQSRLMQIDNISKDLASFARDYSRFLSSG